MESSGQQHRRLHQHDQAVLKEQGAWESGGNACMEACTCLQGSSFFQDFKFSVQADSPPRAPNHQCPWLSPSEPKSFGWPLNWGSMAIIEVQNRPLIMCTKPAHLRAEL